MVVSTRLKFERRRFARDPLRSGTPAPPTDLSGTDFHCHHERPSTGRTLHNTESGPLIPCSGPWRSRRGVIPAWPSRWGCSCCAPPPPSRWPARAVQKPASWRWRTWRRWRRRRRKRNRASRGPPPGDLCASPSAACCRTRRGPPGGRGDFQFKEESRFEGNNETNDNRQNACFLRVL